MKKNELIFEKYAKCKGTNFLNLFGPTVSTRRKSQKILLPLKKNVIAKKFTLLLKKQFNAHNLNEKQMQILRDQTYFKMTEFEKRRQKIQKKFSQYSVDSDKSAMVYIYIFSLLSTYKSFLEHEV